MRAKVVWSAAAALLVGLGVFAVFHSLKQVANRLHDPNPAVRAAAVRGSDSPKVMAEALRDPDDDVRLVAALQLQRLQWLKRPDRAGEETVRALAEALRDRHSGVRREAAKVLGLIGPAAWPALCDALRDPDPRVRAEAAFAVQKRPDKDNTPYPGQLETFEPLLRPLLNDEAPEVRRAAGHALGSVGRRGR